MLEQGDFFEDLSVAAATVPLGGLAADEELRGSFSCNIV